MKRLGFILFAVIPLCSFAQLYLPLNSILQYELEDTLMTDTNLHFSVKPYNLRDISDSSKCGNHISLMPLLSVISTYGLNEKQLTNIMLYGATISADINNHFFSNIDLYGGFFSLSQNMYSQTDSLGIVSHFTNHFRLRNNSARFFNATGYLAYRPNRIFTFEVGNGKSFWGNGYRSLLLSDNSSPYPYLKTTVSVWKIRYVWMISFLQDKLYDDSLDFRWQSKYTSSHFLSWNLNKWFNLNLFEAVIWHARDSLGIRGVDVNYLNPIIFYRPVEFSLGSPDNVIMGGGFNFKIVKKNLLYTQFVFDEFKLAEIKSGQGWWGNKYGWQAGIKAYHFARIKNLMIQTEFNWVRPFTYSHASPLEAYGNSKQSLAHPLGANFSEWLFLVHYNKRKHMFNLFVSLSNHGLSSDYNTGGDIFRPYDDDRNEYGNMMLQGNVKQLFRIRFTYGRNLIGHAVRAIGGIQINNIENETYPYFFVGIRSNFMNHYEEDFNY